jgi:RHS repeat-associated protein
VRQRENGNTGNLYYIHTDFLGSIMALTNKKGALVQEYFYDAWGRRKNPTNWALPDSRTLLIDRGYTGHEHLDGVQLINMNGRIYDPLTARMLSPDPVIQNPTKTQNLNRYSYVMNNPFKYTDPSGYRMAYADFQFYESVDASCSGGGNRNMYLNPYGHDVSQSWATSLSPDFSDYIPVSVNGKVVEYIHPGKAGSYLGNLAWGMEQENKDRKQHGIDSRYSYTGLSATNGDPYGGILGGIYEAANEGGKPDFATLSAEQKVIHLINAGRKYGEVDLNDVFDNVTAESLIKGDGMHMGVMVNKMKMKIGKTSYTITYQLGVKVTSHGYVDTFVNLGITDPQLRYNIQGEVVGTAFNRGYNTMLYITVWGSESKGMSFYNWYNN